MYKWWLSRGLKSKDVWGHGRAKVSKMKKDVREALAREALNNSEILDEVRDPEPGSHRHCGPGVGQIPATEDHGRVTHGDRARTAGRRGTQDLEMGMYG